MKIEARFQFKDQQKPFAVSGVEDHVSDMILPAPGDMVSHADVRGKVHTGVVSQRMYAYEIPLGPDVSGQVVVTLLLDRIAVV